MLLTNLTTQDYYFGPLRLAGGVGQTLTVDDTSETSLYLTDAAVAQAITAAYTAGQITVSGAAGHFPRPTVSPSLLYGDGVPEGAVYAAAASLYLRRDAEAVGDAVYVKTTDVSLNTGWLSAFQGSLHFGDNTGPANALHGVWVLTDDTTTGETANGVTDSSNGFSVIDISQNGGGISLLEGGTNGSGISLVNDSSPGSISLLDNGDGGTSITDNGDGGISIVANGTSGTSTLGAPVGATGLELFASVGLTTIANEGKGLMLVGEGVFDDNNPDNVSIEISLGSGGLWIDPGGIPPFAGPQFIGVVNDPTDGWVILMPSLPTSAPTRSGALWNDSGTVKIT